MPSVQFYLLGQDLTTGHEIEVDSSAVSDYESLRLLVAGYFAILEPSGKHVVLPTQAATDSIQASTFPSMETPSPRCQRSSAVNNQSQSR